MLIGEPQPRPDRGQTWRDPRRHRQDHRRPGLCGIGSAIADEIGTSPALIQCYFPPTAALVAEALVYQDQIFHEEGQRRSDRAGSATEKLGILIDASCPQPPRPDGDPDGWLLWPAAWEMSRHDPSLAEARARLDQNWRGQIAGHRRGGDLDR